jgi:hypothetical protein
MEIFMLVFAFWVGFGFAVFVVGMGRGREY